MSKKKNKYLDDYKVEIITDYEIKMITEHKTVEDKEWFYGEMVKRLNENKDFNFYFKKVGFNLSVKNTNSKKYHNEPCILLEIDKDIDGDLFFIYRGFLFTLLEDIEPKYEWGICRTNQMTECFSNLFEIYPTIKEEFNLENYYFKRTDKRWERKMKKMKIDRWLKEDEKQEELLMKLVGNLEVQKLKEKIKGLENTFQLESK